MNQYCRQSLDYLRLAYDPDRALFSYSTTLDDDAQIISDFRLPESLRYTINTYLGLSEAERHSGRIPWLGDVADRVDEFVGRHEERLASAADHGLLLVLLARTNPSNPAVGRMFGQIERILADPHTSRGLNMQDLAWMLWGMASWADEARSAALAKRLFELIQTRYVHPTGLPRHSIARYRAHTVSFGSIVYYLRAMHEYGEAFGSDAARELFVRGVGRALAIQGADGSWPWMVDVRSGLPFDIYPIFTVHQDSMAMLFLFPAERYGIPGVRDAIERSVKWNFGANQLREQMVHTEPYPWIYRSIERDERSPRVRRYLRGLGPVSNRYPSRSERVRINRECRSYHLGWVLYTWSDPARAHLLDDLYTPDHQDVAA